MGDAAFLAAIRAAPDDDLPRLVYADWLDEQDRPGGDFLRIECELAGVDPEVDRWWAVLGRLRDVSPDHDEDWISAVGRMPPEELFALVRQAQAWLRRRLAVAVATPGALRWDPGLLRPPAEGFLRRRWRRLTRTPAPAVGYPFTPDPEWVAANMRPGDELWGYDSGGESWAHLWGEMGFAVVRNGKVVKSLMLMNN